MNPHSTHRRPQASRWGVRIRLSAQSALALAAMLVQGYHPLAEDGGVYVAGVERLLHPTLFPHYTAFVTEHLRFSLFAPMVVALVRGLHLPLSVVLLGLYTASWFLLMLAASSLLRRCSFSLGAEIAGCALLAAAATVPVAGTSLLLMDPYVTARSLSTPLSLLALASALVSWRGRAGMRSAAMCAACLAAAAAMHPLMAGYAAAVALAAQLLRLRRRGMAMAAFGAVVLAGSAAVWVVGRSQPASAAVVAAELSRYYWFLSQWQWFELLGLLGPLLVLALLRRRTTSAARRTLLAGTLFVALLAIVVALVFAREQSATHLVARLQPLRVFLLVYAVMLMLLGATGTEWLLVQPWASRLVRSVVPAAAIAAVAIGMFVVQRQTFPASLHLELPGRMNPNPWVRASRWSRDNTPTDAVFALDAKYVNEDGEDAQTFRATAERSAIPDYSKDGGEAAITPVLAATWQQGADAQKGLSALDDAERDARLLPLGATWMVLHTAATTSHPCPYRNQVVKVCTLRAPQP